MPDDWQIKNSPLRSLLMPYVHFGKLFGSNCITCTNTNECFKLLLKLNCLLPYAFILFMFINFCTWFHISDTLRSDTILKVAGIIYQIIGVISHTFNLRLQNFFPLLLHKAFLVNDGIIKEKKYIKRLVKISVMTVFSYTIVATIGLCVAFGGPLRSLLKDNELESLDFTLAVFILSYSPSSAFIIAVCYNVIFCMMACCFCDKFHSFIKNPGTKTVVEMRCWYTSYNLLLDFVDLISETFGWYLLFVTGMFFFLIVASLLWLARSVGHLPLEICMIFIFITFGITIGITADLLPVVKVNEKVKNNKNR